jgi:catechol 2,3-dioxygenase
MNGSLALQQVRLRVSDLGRSLRFYRDQLGFAEAGPGALAPSKGAEPILFLEEDRSAPRAPAQAAGLFHAALLLPSRAHLGRWLAHAAGAGARFDGFADHLVSEALYVSDPDGNGLEFYRDRPREDWPISHGQVQMASEPLDIDALLAEAGGVTPEPLAGACWGHLHLRVTSLEKAQAFYLPALGMEVRQRNFPGALFLAADGYHHHLGLNTWGRPSLPQPAGALGLVEAVFARRGATASVLADPDQIRIRVEPFRGTS